MGLGGEFSFEEKVKKPLTLVEMAEVRFGSDDELMREKIGDGKSVCLKDIRKFARGNDDQLTKKFDKWAKDAAKGREKYFHQREENYRQPESIRSAPGRWGESSQPESERNRKLPAGFQRFPFCSDGYYAFQDSYF